MEDSTRQVLIFAIMFATIIGIAIGMFFIYGEYKKVNDNGVRCIQNPILYAGNIMVEKDIYEAMQTLNDSSMMTCNRVKRISYEFK